jgi:hypothetical protein
LSSGNAVSLDTAEYLGLLSGCYAGVMQRPVVSGDDSRRSEGVSTTASDEHEVVRSERRSQAAKVIEVTNGGRKDAEDSEISPRHWQLA